MTKKAVIFDLDGTLTNTLQSIWKSANLALTDVGLPTFEVDCYRYFVGDGVNELVRRALVANGDKGLSHFEKVRERYLYHFEKYVNYEVKPYDGIRELLAELKERGILMAVNSNKPHERTVEVVEEIFGKGTFDMLVGQCDERARKPAPDGVLYIMDKLQLTSDEVIYLGDTCVDMQTGKSAGVFTIGALWGFRDRQELEENHADAIIEHPVEVLDYI